MLTDACEVRISSIPRSAELKGTIRRVFEVTDNEGNSNSTSEVLLGRGPVGWEMTRTRLWPSLSRLV